MIREAARETSTVTGQRKLVTEAAHLAMFQRTHVLSESAHHFDDGENSLPPPQAPNSTKSKNSSSPTASSYLEENHV